MPLCLYFIYVVVLAQIHFIIIFVISHAVFSCIKFNRKGISGFFGFPPTAFVPVNCADFVRHYIPKKCYMIRRT